ncbi:hypothetical protein QVD17_00524 [Tagetes erecta]|uniref:Uncharacterized protein n=1 Tax=Tagetes erecta TaxID=13708 RepID=A0AAD8L593_TARER|nr:hypothetical protein QVD17_00524 [Tagetes erecta]
MKNMIANRDHTADLAFVEMFQTNGAIVGSGRCGWFVGEGWEEVVEGGVSTAAEERAGEEEVEEDDGGEADEEEEEGENEGHDDEFEEDGEEFGAGFW